MCISNIYKQNQHVWSTTYQAWSVCIWTFLHDWCFLLAVYLYLFTRGPICILLLPLYSVIEIDRFAEQRQIIPLESTSTNIVAGSLLDDWDWPPCWTASNYRFFLLKSNIASDWSFARIFCQLISLIICLLENDHTKNSFKWRINIGEGIMVERLK